MSMVRATLSVGVAGKIGAGSNVRIAIMAKIFAVAESQSLVLVWRVRSEAASVSGDAWSRAGGCKRQIWSLPTNLAASNTIVIGEHECAFRDMGSGL